ncbi:hypothetical protein JCM1841_005445, partial [Sporobolomyces salmonicolor]
MSQPNDTNDIELDEADRLLAEEEARTAGLTGAGAELGSAGRDETLEDLEATESLPAPVSANTATA